MAMNLSETLKIWGTKVVDLIGALYDLIFPEFPEIGIIILLIAVLSIIVDIVKKEPVGQAFKGGAALFVTLTILAFFLHLAIRLFMMIQQHTL